MVGTRAVSGPSAGSGEGVGRGGLLDGTGDGWAGFAGTMGGE